MTETEYRDRPGSFQPNGPEIYAVYNTMLALETRWVPAVSGAGREASHPYVAYPLGKFLVGMQRAMMFFAQYDKGRIEPRRFLDVGCGIGTKVALAAQMGWAADGLDFVAEYVDAANELCQPPSRVFQADALDFTEYGAYDVIYVYRPLATEWRMAELVNAICAQTSPQTMLFLPTYTPTTDKVAEYDGEDLWERVNVPLDG